MAEKRSLSNNTLFIGGFNLVVVLLAVTFFTRQAKPTVESKTLQLATGEWTPYSGEHLPQNGIASAVVTLVLNNMGYQVDLHFMPWPQAEAMTAEAESESDIKATFPYARVGGRDRNFYFSIPIEDVEYALYFNPKVITEESLLASEPESSGTDEPDWQALEAIFSKDIVDELKDRQERYNRQQNAELESVTTEEDKDSVKRTYHDKLSNVIEALLVLEKLNARIIRIAGYEYPDVFTPFLDDETYQVNSNVEAFNLLMTQHERRLVVIEATSVAKALIRQNYPTEYLRIYNTNKKKEPLQQPSEARVAMAPQHYTDGVHLISGKKNPENYRFIKRFNKKFIALKNSGKVDALMNRVQQEMENEHQVRLRAVAEDGYLRAYTTWEQGGDYILLANGTHAIVLEWNADYMQVLRNDQTAPESVMVKIKQGPHNGKTVYVDGRSISIP